MHSQALWLSSLVLASLASATPTHPRERFPYPNKGVSHPYTTGTGTGIYPTGTSGPYPISGHTPSSTIHPRAATPTSFKIQYQDADDSTGAPALNGFADLGTGSEYNNYTLTQGYTDDSASAATFTLNADGSLSVGDLIADMQHYAAYSGVIFQTEEAITSGDFYKTYCELDGEILSCSTDTGNYDNDVYYACGDTGSYEVEVGPTGRPEGDSCYDLSLLAVPL